MKRFPKHERFGLGASVQQSGLEVMILLLAANRQRGPARIAALSKASEQLDLLKILLRLAKDIGALQEKQYLHLAGSLIEIGKMLGGWMKSSSTQNRP